MSDLDPSKVFCIISAIKKTINNPLGADLIQFFIKNKKKDATNLTH